MSLVKIDDVCHVRFSAPDLKKMQSFLEDFGMSAAESKGAKLYMRGAFSAPFIHATELGEAGFMAFGLRVNNRDDLEAIAAHDNVPILPLDAPGGGEIVRLIDPDGFGVEVVYGQMPTELLPVPRLQSWNESGSHARIAALRRPTAGPSHVLRLGHVVLGVSDFHASEIWYKSRFGFITSDEIQPAPGIGIGAFMRADRGDNPSDHHTLFLFQHPEGVQFLHAAFEVVDLDDLMVGRDHLLKKEHNAVWGIGRHILGSQIFDYWTDPFGHEIEHWTDGDQLRAQDGSGIAPMEQLLDVLWGMQFPAPMSGEQA